MERCAQCHSASNLRRCKGCLKVWYCSKECQREHWPQHKRACRQHRPTENGDTVRNRGTNTAYQEDKRTREQEETVGAIGGAADNDVTLMTCQKFKKTARYMKKCGRCKEVTYCSPDCQHADWPTHKVTCEGPVPIVTEGYRRMQEEERQRNVQQNLQRLQMQMVARFLRNMTLTSSITWADARRRAEREFPGSPPTNNFESFQGNVFLRQFLPGPLLVCRIGRPHSHVLRHARYVVDVHGNELVVMFYNQGSPEPYFRYDQLKEGNLLCINDAHLHSFLDGSLGFRVDDPSQRSVQERRLAAERRENCRLQNQQDGIHVTPVLTWDEAKSRAELLFPGKRIVDKFSDLDDDRLFMPFYQNTVSISRVAGLYEFDVTYRVARRLKDADGKESHVTFHNEEDPMPYFRYEQLTAGNFLCTDHAHLHVFMDKTVGFRVDYPWDVLVLEP